MELQEGLVLPPFLGTETAPGDPHHKRFALLQLRKRAALPAMIRELVVGKDSAGNDVGSL